MIDCINKITLQKFTMYNFREKEYNNLNWNSYTCCNLAEYTVVDKNDRITTESYYKIPWFRNYKINYINGAKPSLKAYKYNLERISNSKFLERVELTIDEAVNILYDMEEVPDYLIDTIDMSSYESIENYVINHYREIGPIYEEDGEVII